MAHFIRIHRQTAVVYIAIIAMLMPVAGPAIDNHFFERFASHAHVYIGEPDLDHAHVYDIEPGSADSETDSYIATSGDGFCQNSALVRRLGRPKYMISHSI